MIPVLLQIVFMDDIDNFASIFVFLWEGGAFCCFKFVFSWPDQNI
jgi:hypothetical protein